VARKLDDRLQREDDIVGPEGNQLRNVPCALVTEKVESFRATMAWTNRQRCTWMDQRANLTT